MCYHIVSDNCYIACPYPSKLKWWVNKMILGSQGKKYSPASMSPETITEMIDYCQAF